MGDSDQETVVSTLKAYLKLCAKPAHRPLILKDQTVLLILKKFLADDRVVVMTYLVKILLYLSENADDALVLSSVAGLEESLGAAAEKSFPPNMVYNILIVASRMKAAQDKAAKSREVISNTMPPCDGGDNAISMGGTASRKFVSRKSKQLVYEFDELWEELKNDIERRVLSKRGVISIYFNTSSNRATIRTALTVDAKDITDLLFDCGCDMVTQVVKVDGVDEYFKMYASEREKKTVKLPDYLDELDVVDPNSCVVTNDYAAGHKEGGGWFSTISSFVKGSLW